MVVDVVTGPRICDISTLRQSVPIRVDKMQQVNWFLISVQVKIVMCIKKIKMKIANLQSSYKVGINLLKILMLEHT